MEWKVWITWWIIFCIRCSSTFWVYIKKNEEKTGKNTGEKTNSLVMIYTNKIENRITFKIKTGYHLELLTPETMNLIGSNRQLKMKMVKICLI